MIAADTEMNVSYFNVRPFRVVRRAYCDSIPCCLRYGLKREKKGDKESVKQKYILKHPKQGAIHCEDCNHILYWKSENIYV